MLILQLFESLAESELKYHEIIHGVKNYVEEKKLPKHLQDKLLAYYEYRFQGHFFKEQAISNTLSSQFKKIQELYDFKILIIKENLHQYIFFRSS